MLLLAKVGAFFLVIQSGCDYFYFEPVLQSDNSKGFQRNVFIYFSGLPFN